MGVVAALLTSGAEAVSSGAAAASSRVGFAGAVGFGVLGLLATLALLGIASLTSAVLRRRPGFQGLAERVRRAFGASDVVRRHAEVSAGVLAIVLGTLAYRVPLHLSTSLQDEADRARLLWAGTAGAVTLTLLAFRLLVPVLMRGFAWVNQRVPLPVPRAPWARYLLFVELPVTAGFLSLVERFSELLGSRILILAFVAWLVTSGQLHLVCRALRVRLPRRAAWAGSWLVTTAASLVLVSGTWLLHRSASANASEASSVSAASVQVLRELTDVDRDGASSAFGEKDCAPLDPSRHPGAREIPGNRVDEDCSGGDRVRSERSGAPPTTYGGNYASKARRRHVVLVVVDSLRADHLSPYGYQHDTTPYLNALAKEAWLFERAFAQATNTSLSVPSLSSGLDPGSFDWKQGRHYPEPLHPPPTLQKVLRDAGYHTAVSLNARMNQRIPALRWDYESVLVTPKAADWNSAEYSLANAATALSAARAEDKPLLLTLILDGVHTPYIGGKGRALPTFPASDPEVTAYDRGISQVDQTLAALVGLLETNELWDETVFVLTADHGEEFGEHGERLHSTSCHGETVHVPLVLRIPGEPARRVATPVALLDVVPTLLEVLGLPQALDGLDGQSLLLPALHPHRVDPERPITCSIYQVFCKNPDFFIRSVRSGHLALMHEFLHERTTLYDTARDPNELQDLWQRSESGGGVPPQRAEALLRMLRASKTSNLFESRRCK